MDLEFMVPVPRPAGGDVSAGLEVGSTAGSRRGKIDQKFPKTMIEILGETKRDLEVPTPSQLASVLSED